MKKLHLLAALTLALVLCTVHAQTNTQDNKSAQTQLKAEHKADKEQAKADKNERKALKSHKVRKADKQQDKANKTAEHTPPQ